MGQLTGKKQEFDQDYIFATVQTLSKDDHLYRFSPDHFDAIIYDEAQPCGLLFLSKDHGIF